MLRKRVPYTNKLRREEPSSAESGSSGVLSAVRFGARRGKQSIPLRSPRYRQDELPIYDRKFRWYRVRCAPVLKRRGLIFLKG